MIFSCLIDVVPPPPEFAVPLQQPTIQSNRQISIQQQPITANQKIYLQRQLQSSSSTTSPITIQQQQQQSGSSQVHHQHSQVSIKTILKKQSSENNQNYSTIGNCQRKTIVKYVL